MASTVYFMDMRATPKENLLQKLGRLLDTAGLAGTIKPRDLVAVKLHFGELGNTAYIRPVFIRQVVQQIRKCKGSPFLTDANTLYAGTRSDAPSHLQTAIQNGFSYAAVDAPLIIADGMRGGSEVAVPVDGKHYQKVYIGSEIVHADALLSVAHFKGHELSGFGGAIKNLGMGCASRKGKLAQHSSLSPKIVRKKCIGCGECESHCSQSAISLVDEKAQIDSDKCIGCGECILICPNSAIQVNWDRDVNKFQENMVEYTVGVLKGKEGKSLFVNFITDISPACDCYPCSDAPIVRNIGIVASTDPVAIDQASVDLVNQEPALPGSCLVKADASALQPGGDKFRALYPKVDWTIQLAYAEQLGLGSRQYQLTSI